eukprot:scaffold246337_cov35-Tisochrysis_lutea.AAC.3
MGAHAIEACTPDHQGGAERPAFTPVHLKAGVDRSLSDYHLMLSVVLADGIIHPAEKVSGRRGDGGIGAWRGFSGRGSLKASNLSQGRPR